MPKVTYISNQRMVDQVVAAFDKRRRGATAAPPGTITLAVDSGIIQRGGVRHVIFRQETVQLLLSLACDNSSYYDCCRKIGQTASKDLWHLFLHWEPEHTVLPDSLDQLIAVWSGWDKTGGWGSFTFVPLDATPALPTTCNYLVKLSNNFLQPHDATGIGYDEYDAHDFWRGYIHGFLDDALVHAYEPLYRAENAQHALQRLSAYLAVVDVALHSDAHSPSGTDHFIVRLKHSSLMPLFDHLGRAHAALTRHEHTPALFQCVQAALWAKHNHITAALFECLLDPDPDDGDSDDITDDHKTVIARLIGGEAPADAAFALEAYLATKSAVLVLYDKFQERADDQ